MGLQGAAGRQAHEILVQRLAERDAAALGERMTVRHDQHQAIQGEGHGLEFRRGVDRVGYDAELDPSARDRTHDLRAGALFDLEVDIWMAGKKAADQGRQEFQRGRRVGQHADPATQALGELAEFAAHLVELPADDARVMDQGETGRSRADAAPLTLEQGHTQRPLKVAQAFAGGSKCQAAAAGAVGDAGRLGDVHHKTEVDKIEAHPGNLAFGVPEGYRSTFRIVRFLYRLHFPDMTTGIWIFIGGTFLLAGLVKGVIGMGLPTVAMGLLAVVLPPAEAAALLVIPSLVTNVWQLLAGPSFGALARRLWPMMAGVMVGTIAGAGVLAGNSAGLAGIGLGIALLLYGVAGLAGLKMAITPRRERWLGPTIGLTTGLVTGATGVFVIPAVPYLQAIGLGRDDLIQALGLSFTVSTIALAVGLLRVDAWHAGSVWLSLLALAPALLGMQAGQMLRQRIAAPTFRRVFFAGLLLLGAYLVVEGLA
jgi:uncharacterized protein